MFVAFVSLGPGEIRGGSSVVEFVDWSVEDVVLSVVLVVVSTGVAVGSSA